MSAARMALFGEGSGQNDQDKDANAQLVELDNALRSSRVGEQCEAIVRFPRLFEKYPFPILINSAFIKLADVFRRGTNFLRLCVLKVTHQSEKHLDKIINIDEVIKRIFTVIHSNDPVARAITLRTIGSFACVIGERKNVHHSIINALDSHDSIEVEAAIFAADRFADQSRVFANSICNKLADILEGLATPIEMKMKLIPILQNMHHDPTSTAKVRSLCMQLLLSYPGRGFVLVTLHMLSKLAARSLVDIPQQIELLLDYIITDPRRAVKIAALKDLKLLASKGPHKWTSENIEVLCKFVKDTPFEEFTLGGLHVLSTLASTIAISRFPMREDSPLMEICSTYCYHSSIQIAVKATELLTQLAIAKNKEPSEEHKDLIEDAAMALEGLLVASTTDPSQKYIGSLKLVLQWIVRLCVSHPSVSDRFMDLAVIAVTTHSDDSSLLVCESLAAIGSHSNELLPSLTDDLLTALNKALASTHSRDGMVRALCTVLLQASVGETVGENVRVPILHALEAVTPWTAYRVARQAARYGHHQMAAQIFDGLTSKVSTEHFYFWIGALKYLSVAETFLQRLVDSTSSYISNISEAETHYHKAISSLKAAMTPGSQLTFQCQYLELRTQMLQTHAQLVHMCCSFQTSPPPAIASSLAITTGKEIHRCGHIVTQIQKCNQQFETLCREYGELYQSSFDADPGTLMNLQILQQSCQIMIHVLEAVLKTSCTADSSLSPPLSGSLVEHQPWLSAAQQVSHKLHETLTVSPPDPSMGAVRPPSAELMECIQAASVSLMSVPLCLPRYFFQNLQATSIKLAISPQPRLNEPILVHYDSHLTIKVEGVIQHGTQPGLFRKVVGVALSLSSAQQSRAKMIAEVKVKENPTNSMRQVAEPHNDYFSAQFLLAFPIAGIHTVAIEAAVVDENGVEWKTGPTASLTVKSYDEAVQRQQQHQYAAQRQQQRAAMSTSSAF